MEIQGVPVLVSLMNEASELGELGESELGDRQVVGFAGSDVCSNTKQKPSYGSAKSTETRPVATIAVRLVKRSEARRANSCIVMTSAASLLARNLVVRSLDPEHMCIFDSTRSRRGDAQHM